jgi:hypothetical protein
MWERFDALELKTVVDDGTTQADNRANCWPIFSIDEVGENDRVVCYTIYGHLRTGGVDAIADCPTAALARAIAAALSTVTGMPVHDWLVER